MATDDESKEKYLGLSDKVNEMVESVKHAIVLLQIAKVSIDLSYSCLIHLIMVEWIKYFVSFVHKTRVSI